MRAQVVPSGRFLCTVVLAALSMMIPWATPGMAAAGIAPNKINNLDCNGYSRSYQSVRPAMKELCTDPYQANTWGGYRFVDNGHYVGHDEPSIKFISNAPGTGHNMTYVMQLAKDPAAAPTITKTGTTVADYAELSPAPWFGLPMCDFRSYPQNACIPDSDRNSGNANDPNAAGSAFMELQFYPPGFQPFFDAPSCDATRYCAALTIDSLECNYQFGFCNPNCTEPVNFAYLQTNGVPTGPPSPQLTDESTFTPNGNTLMMGQGDTVVVRIRDTVRGLLTAVHDLTTGQTGYMVASGANGFMNTDPQTCNGFPFDFHAEYNTAAKQDDVPWAALEGGVLMEQEIGHFEPCSSVSNQFPQNAVFADGQTFTDQQVYQTCNGGLEGGTGEGPCTTVITTTTCANAQTEGDVACPSSDPNSGYLCEFSDAFCMPKGPRTIDNNGVTETVSWPVAGCQDNYFQNGDLDFDGSSYIADWPDGSPNHPTPFRYLGPYGPTGRPYPALQFETDGPGSEFDCNTSTGAGCTVPAYGASFYPFWSLGKGQSGGCAWLFGNTVAGETVNNFGRNAQYGTPDTARYGGTLASAVRSNPQAGRC